MHEKGSIVNKYGNNGGSSAAGRDMAGAGIRIRPARDSRLATNTNLFVKVISLRILERVPQHHEEGSYEEGSIIMIMMVVVPPIRKWRGLTLQYGPSANELLPRRK